MIHALENCPSLLHNTLRAFNSKNSWVINARWQRMNFPFKNFPFSKMGRKYFEWIKQLQCVFLFHGLASFLFFFNFASSLPSFKWIVNFERCVFVKFAVRLFLLLMNKKCQNLLLLTYMHVIIDPKNSKLKAKLWISLEWQFMICIKQGWKKYLQIVDLII